MDPKDILLKLGFKEHQARIYLTCLELGMASASEISKKAQIQRNYFYDLIKELVNQGFVIQTTKGKKKYFKAIDPEKIIQIQKENLKMAEKVLPELKSVYNISKGKPKVSFYEGQEGIKEIYNDVIRHKNQEMLEFTTEKVFAPNIRDLTWDYSDKRIAANIPIRLIAPVSSGMIEAKKRKGELRKIKMLPRDVFTSDVEINMYANKVQFINHSKEFGLIIESKEIADTLKKLFEVIWSSGKVIE